MGRSKHTCGSITDLSFTIDAISTLQSIGPWSNILRELMGGGQFQFPASIEVMEDPELRDLFTTFWTAGEQSAFNRMKLFKLAWDLVGSDHASRATSYEKFFVGPAFAVRNYNFINAPWDELHAAVEGFMDTYGTGESACNT